MARKVFFSFHYQRDAWRIGQVRNSHIVTANYTSPPFLDWADWEAVLKRGKDAVKKWIDDQLYGSGVTIVLIGNETYTREWVLYEIDKSYKDRKGLLGIFIHNIKNQDSHTDTPGKNPFLLVSDEKGIPLSTKVPTYDWVHNSGRENIGNWIEEAAKKMGR
jgi:hypothetical protein